MAPMLWVIPLALYLVTFIICFDHPRWYVRPLFMGLVAVALLALCMLIGVFAGDALGALLHVKANVGGVGIAMMLLIAARLRC